jgi:hypothetical protein
MASPTGTDLHTPGPLGVAKPTAGIGKQSKAATNYRSPAAGEDTCGDCRFFRAGACAKVTGTISASMTCDLWAPAREQATETFRGVGGRLLPGRGPGGKRTHGQSFYTGGVHGPSILNPAVYDALRRKGMSKEDAAAISNGQLNKKTMGGKWYKRGRHSSGRSAKMSESETFSTPGRARALRALGAARRRNTERVARGEKPVVGGKKVERIPGLTKTKAKQRVKQPRQTTPKGEGPAGFSEERLTLQQFFDKKAYMATYNKGRYGNKKASLGRHRAVAGVGRLNRSKKITMSNPSKSSVGRIARLGMKRGQLSTSTSKTGIKAYVRGFAKARKGRALNEGIAKVNRFGGKGSPPAFRHSESEQYFDKKAYMAAYNARKAGGAGKRMVNAGQRHPEMPSRSSAKRAFAKQDAAAAKHKADVAAYMASKTRGGGSSLARVRGQASTPSAFKLGKPKSDSAARAAQRADFVKRVGSKPLNPRRKVTRKGPMNPRARGPRKGGSKFMMRPGQGQHVPNKYGGGGPD